MPQLSSMPPRSTSASSSCGLRRSKCCDVINAVVDEKILDW
jgi:hypothetical protein